MSRVRHRAAILALGAAWALASSAPPAGAAQVTQVTWDIASGTFGAGVATGPITGGTLSWTPATGTISTPTEGVSGVANVTLTGPSGFVQFTPDGVTVAATVRSFSFFFYTTGKPVSLYSGVSASSFITRAVASLAFYGINRPLTYGATIRDDATTTAAQAGHNFFPGEEVRATIPEPATATLLVGGLAGLAGLTGAGAFARRHRGRG